MDLKHFLGLEKRNKNEGCSCVANSISFKSFLNKEGAMNLSTVFRCVDIISSSVAILPINIKMLNGEHRDTLTNHPLNIVLSDRNPSLISKYTLIKLLVQSVLLRGNAFAYIRRAKDGVITSLQYLEPNSVSINYNKETNELYYTSSTIRGRIEPRDMLHFRMYTYDGINGISVLTYANRSIDLSQSAENNANEFYKDGSNLSGILTVQGQLQDKQKHQIIDAWEQTQGRLRVLQGNMQYTPLSISPEDSQLIETRKYNTLDICRFFGINPILVGELDHSAYSSLEAVQQDFILHTLLPWVVMIEEEMNRKLLTISESNLSIDFDETAILKSDKTATANYYSAMLNNGTLCINECRKELGYSPIEGGDSHIIPFTDIAQNTINGTDSTKRERKKK